MQRSWRNVLVDVAGTFVLISLLFGGLALAAYVVGQVIARAMT